MMLEQEIEKYLSGQTLCNCDSVSYRNIKNLILGFAEPREKRIAELEKENAELKEQLTKAKEIIENIIRVTWGEGWNYSLDWKVKAEAFLKEVEK